MRLDDFPDFKFNLDFLQDIYINEPKWSNNQALELFFEGLKQKNYLSRFGIKLWEISDFGKVCKNLKSILQVINFSPIRWLSLYIADPSKSNFRIDAKTLIDLMQVIGKKQWEWL